MTKLFQGKNGGVPFPRTEGEWIEKKMVQGFSYEDAQKEATHRLRQDSQIIKSLQPERPQAA